MADEPRTKRLLVIVFDALKPGFVTPDLMPSLHAFTTLGVHCRNSHSTFLTETRVNQSAVTSGCYSYQHGLVANQFVAPDISPATVLNTGDDIALERALRDNPGNRLIQVPTLGEMLTSAGKRYATLSAGTSGGGRLINHSAETDDTFRFTMRRPEASWPEGIEQRISQRIGSMPAHDLPATAWITYAVDTYLDFIEPEISPHVMLLWLCEPDESFHKLGIGSEGSRETMRHLDDQFARILQRHADEFERGDLQIIAMSDHGQITLEGGAMNIRERLRDAGFRAGDTFADQATDCLWAGSNAGGIWLRETARDQRDDLVDWLLGEDWVGPIFTRDGIKGTLKLSDAESAHARAADIALVMKANDQASVHASPYPEGGGSHGGLSRHELHNFLALGGRAFGKSVINDLPAGNVDITPTLLALLGLPVPAHCDGRVLQETFAGASSPTATSIRTTELRSTNAQGPRTHLQRVEVGNTVYLHRAWSA